MISAVLSLRWSLFTTALAAASWCYFSSHSCFYICIFGQAPQSFFNVYFQQIFCLFPLHFAYIFLLIQTGSEDEDKMLWGKAFPLYLFLLFILHSSLHWLFRKKFWWPLKFKDKVILKGSATDKVRNFVNRQGRADNLLCYCSFIFFRCFFSEFW